MNILRINLVLILYAYIYIYKNIREVIKTKYYIIYKLYYSFKIIGCFIQILWSIPHYIFFLFTQLVFALLATEY